MTSDHRRGARFTYEGVDISPATGEITSRYSLDGRQFREVVHVPGDLDWDQPGVAAAARILFLLSGISYYKTAAPPVIDLGDTPVTDDEIAFLRDFYVQGLGEFSYVNDLPIDDLQIVGGRPDLAEPVPWHTDGERPLIPFGGGIDSVVVVEETKKQFPDSSLFIVGRFDPIEDAAAVTGLPIVRASRTLDPQVLRSRELGFLNGHVPVTGVLSAIAVLAAVLDHRSSVIMSNEWSASSPTIEVDGRGINHQYSKSLDFEGGFRRLLGAVLPGFRYFSALRPYSELWVAERFAQLPEYHPVFRSCNRAFHVDPALRASAWCGECDKCAFIDLILAPFLPADELRAIFGGREPLDREEMLPKFRGLLGDTAATKPFECVGDVGECRIALELAAARPDRAGNPVLARLRAEQPAAPGPTDRYFAPMGEHFIEAPYAADDLLV
ncbi:UNVERIFIED_ORG: endonuclease domain-containing protein [Bacillus sp. AZ43]